MDIAFITSIIALITVIIGLYKTNKSITGMDTRLLELTAKSSKAEGVLEEKKKKS